MPSSNFTNLFILTAALLILHKPAAAVDDGSGFHGYERDALLHLKSELNSPFLDRNWTGIMCYMDNTPYWYGVQCHKGRVTGLILDSIGLTGDVKVDALANLTELQTLSFKNNSISGRMMEFTLNQKLRSIDLSRNGFYGEIPPSLLNLDSLESLQIQDNSLTGPIPGFSQSGLTRFNVSNNKLSGEIPQTKTLQAVGLSSYQGNANLCGPPTQTLCSVKWQSVSEASSDQSSGGQSHGHGLFVAVLVVVDVLVVVIILLLLLTYYKKYNKLRKEMKAKAIPVKDEEHNSTIMERATERRISVGEGGDLVFVESDHGTTTFDLDGLFRASAEGLGKGNFGNCYKAMMEVGPAVVVKRLRDLKPLNKDEFTRQITAIADQKHPNLLPLLAYFYSKEEKLFVYKFAANGNLFSRIHGGRGTRERIPFRWSSRLAAARGVARALNYLHGNTRSHTAVPHGNLKSTNVLIDESDEILVADYGLTSLIALRIAAQRMVAYKCPEYLSQKSVSKKSDVWSYGCLVLELLTGRVPAHSAAEGVDLCGWVHRAVREEWTGEVFDEEMAVQRGANRGMLKLMQIALKCCDRSPEKRPEMGEVAAEVEEIKAGGESEDDDYSYSSYDRSLTVTDDSMSATTSV